MAIKADLTNTLAVKGLRWKAGLPPQFEVKDTARKGYYMRVSKGGAKRWYYIYTLAGKRRAYSLGTFPAVSCADAFKKYEDATKRVRKGRDIFEEERQTSLQAHVESEKNSLTLSTLFHEHYYARYSLPKLRTAQNDKTYFETKIEPTLGSKPAHLVAQKDVHNLIGPIEAGGQYATARLTLATLRKLYNWAAKSISNERGEFRPLLDISNPCRLYKLGPPPTKKSRYFSEQEIHQIWQAWGDTNPAKILKLQLLTGCRVSEISGMTWDEVDFDSKAWVLPKSRVKNKKLDLLVPLTNRMEELIGDRNTGIFVFPRKKNPNVHTTSNAALQLMKRTCERLGIESAGTHTLRKTFTTHMARLHVPRDIRDRLTNRMEASLDFSTYNLYDYEAEKGAALTKFDQEISRILTKTDWL